MRQTAKALAGATMIATACRAAISQPQFFGLPRALKSRLDCIKFNVSAFTPIETIINWLEAAYGGPIDSH